MSHPHEVPEGWIKGEKLTSWGNGPRCALSIATGPGVGSFKDFEKYMERFPDGGFSILFDSTTDRDAFLKWWYS